MGLQTAYQNLIPNREAMLTKFTEAFKPQWEIMTLKIKRWGVTFPQYKFIQMKLFSIISQTEQSHHAKFWNSNIRLERMESNYSHNA